MSDYVTVVDRFTRTTWQRKIGDGPWEDVDCSAYPGGKPPVVFLRDDMEWAEQARLVTLPRPSR